MLGYAVANPTYAGIGVSGVLSVNQLFAQLLQQLEVVGLSPDHISLLQLVVELRQKYRLPLPDAIITASAIQSNASLVTADQQLQKLQNIAITRFSP